MEGSTGIRLRNSGVRGFGSNHLFYEDFCLRLTFFFQISLNCHLATVVYGFSAFYIFIITEISYLNEIAHHRMYILIM